MLQTPGEAARGLVFQFRKANRPELVRKEEAEIVVLKATCPRRRRTARSTPRWRRRWRRRARLAKDMGKVMKAALAALQAAGKPADGKKVNEAVRRRLGA